MMNKFLELLEKSVILQATMTISILFSIIFLIVTGKNVPDVLTNSWYAILGFYFASKISTIKTEPTYLVDRRKDKTE